MGAWAFTGGMVIAVLAGLLQQTTINLIDAGTATAILSVLGLVVGYLNISDKETTEFLVATVALMLSATALVGALAVVPVIASTVAPILNNFVVFVAPAAAVVAIKALFEAAKNG